MKKNIAKPIEYQEVTHCDGCGHDSALEKENGDVGYCKYCIAGFLNELLKNPRKIKPLYPNCSSYECKENITRQDVDESEYTIQCKKCRKKKEEKRLKPEKEKYVTVYHLPGNP